MDWVTSEQQHRNNQVIFNLEVSISGVPQGLVLKSQLFTICINNLDRGTKSNISNFDDDMNHGGNRDLQKNSRVYLK